MAAAIHLALTPAHFAPHLLYGNVRSASTAYGAFYLAASAVEIALAAALLLRPGRSVFRAGVLTSGGLLTAWLLARAVSPPLVPTGDLTAFAGFVANLIQLGVLLLLAVALPIGGTASGTAPRFARGWAVLTGLAFVFLFVVATGSLGRVPFNLAKGGSVPRVDVATLDGFSFLSPWLEVVFSKHVVLGVPWTIAAFLVVAAVLVGISAGLTVGLARCPGACRPQASGIAAALPAFFAVPTCCGVALPIGATLGGATLVPLLSAAPWVLLGSAGVLGGNVLLLRHRWRKTTALADERGGR